MPQTTHCLPSNHRSQIMHHLPRYNIVKLTFDPTLIFNLYRSLGLSSRRQIDGSFYFSQHLTFRANCLHETVCMKCQILFSGKNTKNISKCRPLKTLYRVLSVKDACSKRGIKDAISRSYSYLLSSQVPIN